MRNMISVIVTIYNKEQYLDRCIQSIQNQSYRDLEVLLIDDGSTDSSYNIIQKYALNDKRIKCFRKENGGLVSCWQYGLKLCSGKYVAMVDADDWLEEDALYLMAEKAEKYNCDIVIGGATTAKNSNECKFDGIYQCDSIIEVYKELFNRRKKGGISLSRWAKLYRRDLIVDNFKCDYKGNWLEDIVYVSRWMLSASSIFFLNKKVYTYFEDNTSMSRAVSYNAGDFDKYEDIFNKLLQNIDDLANKEYATPIDIFGYFLWNKIALLLLKSTLSKRDKKKELAHLMTLNICSTTIRQYKFRGANNKLAICRVMLILRLYGLIVSLKG